MLDDSAAHAFEIVREFRGGGGVEQIIEGEFLAAQNLRIAERKPARTTQAIERALLVGVLPVAERLNAVEIHLDPFGKRVLTIGAQIAGYGGVRTRGVAKRLQGQASQPIGRKNSAVSDVGDSVGIIVRIDEHGHAAVVLGSRAHHGGAADVDLLDRLLPRDAGPGDGLPEGIEVHRHQVDGRDVVRPHLLFLIGQERQNTAQHLGVKRLDASAHDFGLPRIIGNLPHGNARIAQRSGRTAGG